MQKRSLTIAGHRTSIALEPDFWQALAEIAEREGLTLPQLIARVDEVRTEANLASALRLFVLRQYRESRSDAPEDLEIQSGPQGRDEKT